MRQSTHALESNDATTVEKALIDAAVKAFGDGGVAGYGTREFDAYVASAADFIRYLWRMAGHWKSSSSGVWQKVW